jgi:hypothetical protein
MLFPQLEEQLQAQSTGGAHRISRHALSLFNCDFFEEY